MKTKDSKRLLSTILALVMVFCFLPTGDFAYANNGDAQPAVESEQTGDDVVTNEGTSECDHSWGKWKVTKKPTCTKEGERERVCETCGETETEKVDKTDHNWDKDGLYCTDCKILKSIAEGGSYDFKMDGEKWVIAGDESADTEDKATWKDMFADLELTDNWAKDLVKVAKTQIGYKESSENFAISEDLDRNGYTRYGDWAGEPYGDWSEMFVSFCLHYANVSIPEEESSDEWAAKLDKEGMFAAADGYVPRSGDLIFFDRDGDGTSDSVGIVESYNEDTGVISTIEGDNKDKVTDSEVDADDSAITGYGILPENKDASDKDEPEQEEMSSKALAKGEPTRGEGDGYPPGYDSSSEASVYGYGRFGPEATPADPRISVQIVQSANFPSKVMAGDTLNYEIRYSYLEIPELNFGYPKAMPLYDKYKNNTITLTLPAGLLLNGQESPASDLQRVPDNDDPNVAHTYTFVLPEVTANDQKKFGISVYVCNNGTDKSVATYDSIQVSSHTEFDIVDYSGGKETFVGHYAQDVNNSIGPITTTTPDEWGVEKSIKDDYPKFNSDKTKAIFAWDVKVGLLDNDGNIITDVGEYKRNGRDALESIKLKDALSTVFTKDNSNPSGTLTISKGDASKTFTSDEEIELKDGLALNVSAEADMITTNGTSNPAYLIAAPTLTTYTVTAEYNVTPEMIAEFYENPYKLNSTNKVKISEYKLADMDKVYGDYTDEYPESLDLPLTDPASIEIGKYLREYAAGNMSHPYDERYGAIAFKLTDLTSTDGKFTVYEYRANPAPHYVPIEGMENVTEATLEKDKKYYLYPGHKYRAVEALTTAQSGSMALESIILNDDTENPITSSSYVDYTPSAKEDYTVDFVNKEVRGRIIVNKEDDKGDIVIGAVFGLFDENGNPIYKEGTTEQITATTGDDGKATFKNVPYGTYQVKELSAPENYVMDTTPKTIVVGAEGTNPESLKFVNKKNGATLELTKYVGVSGDYSTANANFAGKFKLYKRKQGTTSWGYPVVYNNQTEFTVGSNGKIQFTLPPFDTDGTPFEYKIVEDIPDGYYDPATESTDQAETAPVTLTTAGTGSLIGMLIPYDKDVEMYNRKLVKAHIQKKFYSVGADGKLAFDEDQTTTATLYKYVGDNTSVLTPVQADFTIGGTDSGEPRWVDFANLKLYEPVNGVPTRVHYLIKEDSITGYTLDWDNITGSKETINGVDYIELELDNSTVNSAQPEITAVFYNIEQKIPVKVVKYDYYTGKYVSGSKYTAYKADGSTVINDEENNGRTLSGISVPEAGDTFFVKPGQVYTIKESTVPSNYHLHSYTDANGTKVETTISGDKYGKIDLTGDDYVLSFEDVGVDKTVERRIYNYQDPLIRIMKNDTDQAAVDGAKFTVYKKADNGDYYVAVTDVDAIDSNEDSDVRLPEGDYYIHESTVPSGYLDPDKFFDLYHDKDSSYIQGHIGSASGQEVTLRPVTVTNGKMTLLDGSGTDNICKFDFINIKNKGSLKVLKKVYDTLTQGFTIVVKRDGVEVARKDTDRNGAAVFDDLPVYDDNGQLIQYTITEELSSTQEPVYYQASADQIATLSTTDQTTKDTENKDLVVVNHTKVQIDVRKVFRNTWDYVFTHMDYPMSGATIGLFVKEGDNWVKVGDSATTNNDGYASFTGLRRDKEYALVELSSGNENYFPYNVDGTTYAEKWKLRYPSQDGYTNSIPDSAMGNYNVRYMGPDQLADKTKLDFTVDKDLVNANHWVQFDITKWLDADTYTSGQAPIYGTEVNKTVEPKDTKYDNAVFDFYRFVMPEDTGSIGFRGTGFVDGEGNPVNWELVGTYSSGTKYNQDGIRQIGEFMTNVEQNVNDHYVYLLVERDPGPGGAVVNPNFKYTFWQARGKSYTISVVDDVPSPSTFNYGEGGYQVRTRYYDLDQVNEDDILNAHPEGPGTGVIYLASIRIAKWQAVLNTKTGEWEKKYTPLPNTEFEVRLNNKQGKLLTTLTTGLDATGDDPKAWAQSGTYQLLIDNGTPYALKDYETGETITAADGLVVTPFETTKDGVTYYGFRIPVVLLETDCPEGYSYDTEGYEMYLCFFDLINGADGTSWVFNDAFFATDDDEPYTLAPDGTQTAWYITNAENYDALSSGFFLGDDQSIRRIVDYPIHNTFVTVHKYGYAPNEDTVSGKMTSTDLDNLPSEEINREPLPGVTMYLQHRKSNGTWEFWDYKLNKATTTADNAKFVTTEGGGYIFPDGLKPGTYRIYETSLPDDERSTIYNNAAGTQKELIKNVYEMAYYNSGTDHTSADSHSRARIFTVGTDNKSVTMYNPKKVDLTLIKKDLDGNALNNTNFSLKYSGGALAGVTGNDGKVVFKNIASNDYWLVETKAGYSSEYLQQYLTTIDPTLAGLADENTKARIGYTLATDGDVSSDRDTYVNVMSPSKLIVGSADLELTIKNPEKVNIEITKVDDRNNAITTGKAKFKAYYHPFTQDGNEFKFKDTFSNPSSSSELTSAGFTQYPDGNELETDANGKLNLTNLDPGIYAFIETEAPAGYDVLKTSDGKDVIYFVIVKGGLDATVTGLTSSVNTWAGSVTTLTEVNGTEAVFSAKNYQKVTMSAKKELVYPDGADADSWTIYKPWEVRLDLYASDKSTVLGSATFTSISTEPVTFKKNGADVKLSKGETYYVKEAVVKPTAAFDLVKLLVNGTEVTGTGEFYPVTVTEDGIVVTAQNKFLWGQVKFKKYDGADIEKNDFTHPLEGAVFEVRYNENAGIDGADESWVKVPNSTVEYDASTKAYIADIPLISETPTTYRIYEKEAPPNHLLDPYLFLEVKVPQIDSDGKLINIIDYTNSTNPDMVNKEYLVNTEGNNLYITKYNNLYPTNYLVGEGDASFTIYHRKAANDWEVVQPQTGTNSYGMVTYLMTPGETYAVAETAWATSKFIGLDGIYRVTGEGEEATETLLTDTVDINGVTAYVIQSSSEPETIRLKAYNKPLIKPTIVKQDAGNYPKNIVPLAFFSIYEVDADFVANDSSVEALVNSKNDDDTPKYTPVYEGYTEVRNTYTGGGGGTFGIWDAAENGGAPWDPTKKYVIVETKVASGTAGEDYNTMNKDDNRVDWYTVAAADPDPDPDHAPVYYLRNVYGDADAGIVKTVVNNTTAKDTLEAADDPDNAVVNNEVESLLTGQRKVVYTITPSADTHNQALDAYSVTDSGITFTKKKENYDGGPQPSYSIDSITIGKATQDTSKLDFTIPENTVVSAKVTFTLADGSTDVQTVDLTNEQGVDVVPNGKAKSFVIDYYSNGVSTATGGKYVLGYDFTPGEITVNATINKLDDGDSENPVNEVTSFTNTAAVHMEHSKWKEDGSELVAQEPVDKESDATINVKSLRMPKISVSKEATDGTTTIQHITLGGFVIYKIGISNTGDTDFINPVILDMLPTGVTFDPTYEVTYDSNTHGQNEQYKITAETRTGKVTQTYQGQGGVPMGDAETAVIFKLKGEDGTSDGVIKAGSTIYLYFKANIKDTAGMYEGDMIENDVFASTAKRSYHTTDNPDGFGFTDTGGKVPGTLDQASKALDENGGGTGTVAQTREGGLHEALGSYAYNATDNKPIEYVWVPAKAEVTYGYASKITLKKAVWGDRDAGFEESKYFLGMSTRTNVPGKNGAPSPLNYADPNLDDTVNVIDGDGNEIGTIGWTKWRLSVENGSPDDLNRIVIGDIIPKENDGRLSSWESVWRKMLGVQMKCARVLDENGQVVDYGETVTIEPGEGSDTDPNKYTIFFYVGPIDSIIDQTDPQSGHVLAEGVLTKALKETAYWNESNHIINKPATDEGNWKTLDQITDYTTIKAFIIVFDKGFEFRSDSDLVASYQTTVANMLDGTVFNNNYAYKNDNNIFRMNYNDSLGLLTSNQVSVTLMDKPVSVEGDLWIDEDWDGVQNKGNVNAEGTTDWTTNGNRRDYTQYAIINELKEATHYTIKDLRSGQGTLDTDQGPGEYIGYGESVEHFRFEELIPGAIAYEWTENESQSTSPKYIYDADDNLRKEGLRTFDPAMYSLHAEVKGDNASTLMSNFKVTKKGKYYYRSNNPDILDKDLDEVIENYVLDDNFFADVSGKKAAATKDYATKSFFIRYSTDIDKTKDWGLQQTRELIIEKRALDNPNFKIAGAKFEIYGSYGDSDIGERKEATASGTKLSFSLSADGVYHLAMQDKDDNWFLVWEETPVDESTIKETLETDDNGQIKVAGINFWKEYDIKEVSAPGDFDASGAVFSTPDNDTWTRFEDKGNGIVTLKVPDPSKTLEDGPDQLIVENPRPVAITPKATKEMDENSKPLPQDTEFQFTLTATKVVEGGGYWMDNSTNPPTKTVIKVDGDNSSSWTKTITVPAGQKTGTVSFEELNFIKTGTYEFEIKEAKGTDGHFTYDGSTWVYTVVVDTDGDKLVATGSYAKKDESGTPVTVDGAESATFINDYTPEPDYQLLRVEKLLTGEPLYDAAGTKFIFQLTEAITNPGPGDPPAYEYMGAKEVTITGEQVQQAVDAGERATADFGEIKFNEAGTYNFMITEFKEQDAETQHPNVIYDDTTWNAEIVVEDKGGKLEVVKAEYTNDKDPNVKLNALEDTAAAALFTNDYTPGEDTWRPYVEKIMSADGDTTEKEMTFTFKITAGKVVENGSYWMDAATDPADKKIIAEGDNLPDVEITVPAGTAPGSVIGPEAFEWIHFTKKGEYVFNIVEVIPDNVPEGFTYAEGTAIMTVTVDDINGYMKVTKVDTSTSSGATGIGFAANETDNTLVAATFTNGYTSDKPPTGDDTNLLGLLGAMTGSITALLALVLYRRRREE